MTSTTRSMLNRLFVDEPPADLDEAVEHLESWAQAPQSSAARAAGEEAVWTIIERWAVSVSEQDVGQTDPSWIGRWTVSEDAMRIVNSGLLDDRFNQDEFEGDGLIQFLDRAFAETSGPAQIMTFLDALRSEYKRLIKLPKGRSAPVSTADLNAELEASRAALTEKLSEMDSVLGDQPDSAALLENQRKLNEALGELAQATALSRKSGISPKDRRLQMKITENSRRLIQANFMAIETYADRKSYESLQKESVELEIKIQELEARAEENSGSEKVGGLTAEACATASKAAVGQLRKVMGRVARTPAGSAPPFVLEHAPRLAPIMVAEKVEAVFRAAPRLQNVIEGSPLEIWVLPGLGNPVFDRDSGRVWVALFPSEVKLHTILMTVGEALVQKSPRLIKAYQRTKKLSSESKAWEQFRKDFVAWVEADSLGRRTLDTATSKWFESELTRQG